MDALKVCWKDAIASVVLLTEQSLAHKQLKIGKLAIDDKKSASIIVVQGHIMCYGVVPLMYEVVPQLQTMQPEYLTKRHATL